MAPLRKSGTVPLPRGKTYLYVSDAKVDMWTDRLGPSLREQFGLTVSGGLPGVIDAEVELREVRTGRFTRAERLCAALAKSERLGAIDAETQFFRGKMLGAWGFWNRFNKGYADVVFFHGFLDSNTFVGIGGSAYYTMERDGDRVTERSNSGIQSLMAFLRERSEHAGPYAHDAPGAWPSEAWEADHDNPAVPEPIEFVAERYLDDQEDGMRTIIGSPIYVARTGQPITRRVLKEYQSLREDYAIQVLGKSRRQTIGKPSFPKLPPLLEPGQGGTQEG